MKPEKITIDFATYEAVFEELAKWQRRLQRLADSPTSQSKRVNARAAEHTNKVQALLDTLVDAEFNED